MKISLLTPIQEESISRLMEVGYKKLRFETDTDLREYVVDIKEVPTSTKDRMVKSRLLQEIREPDFSEKVFDSLIKDIKILNYLYMTEVRKEISIPDLIELLIMRLLKTRSEETIMFLANSACISKRAEGQEIEEQIRKATTQGYRQGYITIHPPEHNIESVKTLPLIFTERTQKGRVYRFLHYYWKYWTAREINERLRLHNSSKSSVNKLIKQLLKERLIEQDNSNPPKYRCIHHL